MDEVKRYMRYLLPGLTSMGILLLVLYISDPVKIKASFNSLSGSSDLIELLFGLFFASGALGFLLANIYTFIYWTIKPLSVNHIIVFKQLFRKIEIVNPITNKKVSIDALSKRRAWEIFTRYSYCKIANSNKEFQSFIDRLVDILQSLGSLFVGILISSFVWAYLHFKYFCGYWSCSVFLVVLLFAIILFIIAYNFHITDLTRQRISNDTFTDYINKTFKKNGKVKIIASS